MKNLLILALISICMTGLYSKEIIGALNLNGNAQRAGHAQHAGSAQHAKPITVESLETTRKDGKHHAMTPEEFAALSQKDPDAYRKFLQSHEEPQERGEIDKLMNLLAHGKYE